MLDDDRKGVKAEFNNSENLLVIFGGINQEIGIPIFEFYKSLSKLNSDKIFIRDFNQAWYQKGVDLELDHINKLIIYLEQNIKIKKYKQVCFIGNSMGGYASILFGTIIGVNKVIAFSPQSFIDRKNRFFSFDRRWRKQIAKIYSFNKKENFFFDLKKILKKNNLTNTRIEVYFSSNHRLDSFHARRLSKFNNIQLYPQTDKGHSIVKQMKDDGRLVGIIDSIF